MKVKTKFEKTHFLFVMYFLSLRSAGELGALLSRAGEGGELAVGALRSSWPYWDHLLSSRTHSASRFKPEQWVLEMLPVFSSLPLSRSQCIFTLSGQAQLGSVF